MSRLPSSAAARRVRGAPRRCEVAAAKTPGADGSVIAGYAGDKTLPFDDRLAAVPIAGLWSD